MAEHESTLCWDCKNTNRHKCSWFNPADPQPVPGWVAELRPKSMIGESYMVKECPNFDPEPKRDAPPPPPGLSVPGVQRRKTKAGVFWVARITRGTKYYHLGNFTSMEKATAARLAAEEAIARGEEPKCKRPPRNNTPSKEPKRKEPRRKEYPPGYCPGVRPDGRFWSARITRKGRVYYLGYFKTEEEAIAARRAAEEALDRGEEPKRREAPPRRPPAKKPQAETPPPAKPQAKQAVCGVRRGRRHWTAHIQHEGKTYHLGYFKTEEQAIAARRAAEKAIKRGETPAH